MQYTVPLFDLNYDQVEEQAVLNVLRSKWISMGPQTEALERAFAAHLGVRHAIAVTNCTAALHLGLVALGIGPGDEVVVPSLTFVATVNCVGYVGATPVFADICALNDFSIDPECIGQLITHRTKAIIPMHYGGFPCDMERLVKIAREHNLAIVEDAAHAPATRYNGKAAGTFGDTGCFSFYANKNIACGEGGVLVTNRDDIAERVRLLRSHGMTTLSFDRARGHATEYDVVVRGYNFRMDDIRAALALAQLGKLQSDTAARARLRQMYVEQLKGLDEIIIPYLDCPHQSSHYIMPVVLKNGGAARRNAIRQALARRGIQTSVHYPAVHQFAIYRSIGARLPRTEHVAAHEITLPLHGKMTEATVSQVVQALAECLAE